MAPRGEPWDHSAAPWKTLLKPWFLHVCPGGTLEIQVDPFARLGERDGYSESFGNHWENVVSCKGAVFLLAFALVGVYTSLLVQLPERKTASLASIEYLVNPMGKQGSC